MIYIPSEGGVDSADDAHSLLGVPPMTKVSVPPFIRSLCSK